MLRLVVPLLLGGCAADPSLLEHDGAQQRQRDEASLAPDAHQVIVRLDEAGDFGAVVQQLEGSLEGTRWARRHLLPLFSMVSYVVDDAAHQRLEASPDVIRVTDNKLFSTSMREAGPLIGANRTRKHGARGAGATIAIIDDGFDIDHRLLSDKAIDGACFSTADPVNNTESLCPNGGPVQLGLAGAVYDPSLTPGYYHGTHVAGIASAIAPDADLVFVNAFSKRTGPSCVGQGSDPCLLASEDDLTAAAQYVLYISGLHNIRTANLSLGAGPYIGDCDGDPVEYLAMVARLYGILPVAASGNNGSTEGVSNLSCASSMLAVGATDDADRVAAFSNAGPQLDMVAPGVNIVSTYPGGGFGSLSGTSMAAPMVAGAGSVLASLDPAATPDEIEALLEGNATTIIDQRTGLPWPRLQLDAAAIALLTGP